MGNILTDEQIETNKQTFLSLVDSITIEGMDKEGLIEYLNKTDFFTAPASTKYHSACKGGLCRHSLNVYKILNNLLVDYKERCANPIDSNSVLVVSLFHDISKANYYKEDVKNKKIYSPEGKKSDNMGNYDWFSELSYKVRDAEDRMLFADHGTNSMYIISRYIPLSDEEACAIINHHAGMDNNMANYDMTAIYNRYSLAALLHIADMLATYVIERI